MNSLKNSLSLAALSGALAVFPMSAVMLMCRRFKQEPRSVPPEDVTRGLIKNSNMVETQTLKDKGLLSPLVWGGHFAYGMAAGSVYSGYRVLFPKAASNIWIGASYGLFVWWRSYWVWIPKQDILPPPTQTSPQNNFTRILSHIVWGAALAKTYEFLQPTTHDTDRSRPTQD